MTVAKNIRPYLTPWVKHSFHFKKNPLEFALLFPNDPMLMKQVSRCFVYTFLFISIPIFGAVNSAHSSKAARQAVATQQKETQKTSVEEDIQRLTNELKTKMAALTPDKRSALETRIKQEALTNGNTTVIPYFKPTYILPFYYTSTPYHQVYDGKTPNQQRVMPSEFKAQFSLKFSLIHNILGQDSSLTMAYTQLMYWQVYASSQYFRETNYEPEIFLSKRIIRNWWTHIGIEHQSNGRGGDLERSWNRAYIALMLSNRNWLISLRPWVIIFRKSSIDRHNSNIGDYLGHGEIILSYKATKNNVISLMLRNYIENGFKRGATEFDWSFPLFRHLKGYFQIFNGYGQSLIEYDHKTWSAGIGIALSDWI